MQRRVQLYVLSIVLLAIVASAAVYAAAPTFALSSVFDALFLCTLAVAGELLTFVLPYKAMGSIGYIPYFAAAIVVPGWPSVLGVALVRGTMEVVAGRQLIKKALNTASYVAMEATAILVYLYLGGRSLSAHAEGISLTRITRDFGAQAIIAFILAFVVNNLIVFIAIALASGRSPWSVMVEAGKSTIILDLLTTPLIFIFAWVYAAFGSIAGAALWVPILGLRQVHRINLELERTNEELLELMVKSLEARDPYTSGHSRRVQQYSVTIARALGLTDRQVAEIGRAALLHDVGKIHEKYAAVLAKQDKLTSEEWAIIRDHPEDGANLVATMTRLRDIVPAIRHHHENWDGTGYPSCLTGELIPLASRIIRFADTIDAMTTERPYRGPMAEFEVRNEVVRCRGTQFDPQIADRLLSSPLWLSLFPSTPNDGRTLQKIAVMGRRRRVAANDRVVRGGAG
ncbi:MAG TPA: HD domain-containing phosphohydrolase [Gemmatimonadaceae bacterium]|jgi:putative nucleotidyltransferase with HDIG domain